MARVVPGDAEREVGEVVVGKAQGIHSLFLVSRREATASRASVYGRQAWNGLATCRSYQAFGESSGAHGLYHK